MNSYPNVYFQNQVETASRENLLIMLYDGAILFLRQARQARENGKKVTKIEKTGKVVNILTELSNTLDFENGGEMAVQLDSLYWYLTRELIRSNTQDDPQPLDVAERILVDLRDGWIQAIEQNTPAAKAGAGYGQGVEESEVSRPISAAV
ncbi:MAG: flagellar export chaperone FliS [Desulfobacterales bacterium]